MKRKIMESLIQYLEIKSSSKEIFDILKVIA